MKKIHDLLNSINNDEISTFNKKKIQKYINQRDNNIITNQRRMLNSLLDQKPNIIKIDRLLYKDENDDFTFTTNKYEIED